MAIRSRPYRVPEAQRDTGEGVEGVNDPQSRGRDQHGDYGKAKPHGDTRQGDFVRDGPVRKVLKGHDDHGRRQRHVDWCGEGHAEAEVDENK